MNIIFIQENIIIFVPVKIFKFQKFVQENSQSRCFEEFPTTNLLKFSIVNSKLLIFEEDYAKDGQGEK